MYVIVDIETTGGYASRHSITEIAVALHDGNGGEQRWQTLVKPTRNIPAHITALTGIDEAMVASAPTFEEIADKLQALTEGRVFVAHNVNFDYSFVKEAFRQLGLDFNRKKLCTVRLSRKLFPGFASYSLGPLCDRLGIPFTERHRAGADVEATVQLFEKLLAKDTNGVVQAALNQRSREATLPPNLPKAHFEALPEAPGVYYFRDAKGKVLYVGKAKRLRTRVSGHFTGRQIATWQKQGLHQRIHKIDFDLTGNELIALLLEAHQVQKHWPRYNKAIKQKESRLGLVQYTDRSGYLRLGVQRLQRFQTAVVRFHSSAEARNFLWSICERFELCPQLVGLAQSSGPCIDRAIGRCLGACEQAEPPETYNARVLQAIEAETAQAGTFAIVGQGREKAEKSVVLVEDGVYKGFGFAAKSSLQPTLETLKPIIEPRKEIREIRSIIAAHLRSGRGNFWSL